MDDHEKAAREIRDPIERIVAEALDRHGIRYKRDPKMHDLDFHLPDLDILIEAKQFYTNRIWRQLTGRENVVLIQGRQAAEGFASALKAAAEAEREACAKVAQRGDTRTCPFPDDADGLEPSDPCPVCGMTGELEAEDRCVGNPANRIAAAIRARKG